jgi:glycosyltransferase involved in cell wall biosynthesis
VVLFSGLLRRRPEAVLLDVRDLTWEYAMSEAPASRMAKLVGGGYRKLVGAAASRASLVSCVTAEQGEAVSQLSPNARIMVVPNGLSSDMQERLAMPAPLGRSGPSRFLYAGNIGRAQDVAQLIGIARLSSEVELHLAGDGPEVTDLEAALIGQPNARYLGKLDASQLRAAYEWADALVACLRPERAFQSAIPSKLYEYTATGRLLVFVGEGAGAQETVRLHGYATREVSEKAVNEMVDLIRERRLGRAGSVPRLPVREELASDLVAHLFEASGVGRGQS